MRELYPVYPVLVVDDEEHFLDSMKVTLQSNGLRNVECCLDSRTVMTRLRGKNYSLILLDIVMPPYINGDKLLPEIIKEYPHLPVFMMTGTIIEDEKREKFKDAGALDCLEKTISSETLIAVIRKALSNIGL